MTKKVTQSCELPKPWTLELKAYLPYIIGGLLGFLAAFFLSALLSINGTPQLIVFGLLPALGGATCERVAQRGTGNP